MGYKIEVNVQNYFRGDYISYNAYQGESWIKAL